MGIEMEQLLDAYEYEMEIALNNYNMMGQMLDVAYVQSRLRFWEINELYIYGGGYTGIQLYNAAKEFANVQAIVDKTGALLVNIPDIPVINMEEFRSQYQNQKVIITPNKFYQEIQNDISSFVPQEKMIYLGEFLGGLR